MPSSGVRIGAFNLKNFGKAKMGRANVVEAIVEIIVRLSLCFVQEVRDARLVVPGQLLNALNTHDRSINGAGDYAMRASARLGRGSYKEQYIIFFRTSVFTHEQVYQYTDPGDRFEREPYGGVFTTSIEGEGCVEIGIFGMHADPDVADVEVGLLHEVHQNFVAETGVQNVIIMGDLNADCSYITASELAGLSLRTNPIYTWLIGDNEDTTEAATHCAYDRIIITGPDILDIVDEDSAAVYRFDQGGVLPSGLDPASVSNNFPVEVDLRAVGATTELNRIFEGVNTKYRIAAATIGAIRNQLTSNTINAHNLQREDTSYSTILMFTGVKDIGQLTSALNANMPGLFPRSKMNQVTLDAASVRAGEPHPVRCMKDLSFSNTVNIFILLRCGEVHFYVGWLVVED